MDDTLNGPEPPTPMDQCCWWCGSNGPGEVPAVSQLTTDQRTPMCAYHLTAWYVLLDSLQLQLPPPRIVIAPWTKR